jgi:hypothetical protein
MKGRRTGGAEADGTADRAAALALLRGSGLTPTEAEVAALMAGYRSARRLAATLHAMRAARHEEPALTFDPRTVDGRFG